MTESLPSAADCSAVQEALSIRYVDKIGLCWLPEAKQWAVFSNSGKLLLLTVSLREEVLQDFCQNQDREWRASMEAQLEARRPGPSVTSKSLGELDL